MAQAPDARSQTFVDAFWPLQKLLDNNAISPSAYKAVCAILEHELDNGQMQSEQEVIIVIQTRAQAQIPPAGITNTPPPSAQGQTGNAPNNNTQSRGLGDDDQSRGFFGGHHHNHGGHQQQGGYGPPGYFTGQSGYYAGPYQTGYPQGPPGYQQGFPQQGYQQPMQQSYPQNMSPTPILGGGGGHQQGGHQFTNFAERMGNIVVSSMAGGFGGTLGSQAAHSLWNKF